MRGYEETIPVVTSLGGPILVGPQESNETRIDPRVVLPRRMWWDCRYQRYRLVDKSTGEAVEFDCKQWSCLVHGPRVAWRWKMRLGAVPWTHMVTLTLVPGDKGEARIAWQRVARWMRKETLLESFVRVMEYGGRSGMRHWHILTIGRAWKKADLGRLRDESRKAGLGSRVHVGRVGDRYGAVAYLLKYALKDIGVLDARRRGWRCITSSRDISPYSRVLERLGKEPKEKDFELWKGETLEKTSGSEADSGEPRESSESEDGARGEELGGRRDREDYGSRLG